MVMEKLDQLALDQLAEEIDQDTIIFIGSGLSVWSGLPSWIDLIYWLKNYTASLGGEVDSAEAFIKVGNGDFLSAAGCLILELRKIGKNLEDFFTEYEECSSFTDAIPAEIHNLVADLPTESVITPNYDLLVEKSFESLGKPVKIVQKDDNNALAEIIQGRLKNYVLKYHGCITRPELIVLDQIQYRNEMYGEGLASRVLRSRFESKKIIFIGSALSDLDLDYIRNEVVHALSASSLRLWAFMRNCDARREYYEKTYGIKLINYKGSGKDHSDLINVLKYLLSKIGDIARKRDEAISVAEEVKNSETDSITPSLSAVLADANDLVTPVDHQIIGFVFFSDGSLKADCISYLVNHKGYASSTINNRIEFLVQQSIIVETENYLLPVKSDFSAEAAELIEDDIVEYVAGQN